MSPSFIAEKFPIHRDPYPVALGIWHFFHVHGEVDVAHDAWAKFFFDQRFEGRAIHVDDFLKTVLERFLRNARSGLTLVGILGESLGNFRLELKCRRHLFGSLLWQGILP